MHLRFAIAAVILLAPGAAHAQDSEARTPSAATAPAAAANARAGTTLGAATLTAALKDYLGPIPFDGGFVSIAPDPKGYRITFGAKGAFTSELPGGGSVSTTLTPYSMIVSQRGDGNWQVDSDGAIAMSYDAEMSGQTTHVDYAINGLQMSGVYAPDIRAFLTATGKIDEITMAQQQPTGEIAVKVGPQSFETRAEPDAGGHVDYRLSQRATGFTETIRMPLDPAAPDQRIDIVVNAGGYTLETQAAGLRTRPIADLFALLLRNADKDKIRAAEDDLKRLVGDSLPLWTSIGGENGMTDISVETPYGSVKLADFRIGVAGDGIVEDGSYRYSFASSGMTTDIAAIPAWSKPFIPRDVTMDVVGAGVDLATPMRILLANLDLSADKPVSDEAGQEILASFEAHRPTLRFENVKLAARDYELTMNGEVRFDAEKPETRFDIVATGLDAALKALQDAGAQDPAALQGFAFGSMAKGFGKPLGDDKTGWLIETAADGSVKINGVTIKGPDTPAPEAPALAPETAPDAVPAPPAPEGGDDGSDGGSLDGDGDTGGDTGGQPL
ncbi:MAG: hypothetical protein CMP81_12340 [Fulvimarina sp.]|nr:hypothetical protein [Fulvimarina sp.]